MRADYPILPIRVVVRLTGNRHSRKWACCNVRYGLYAASCEQSQVRLINISLSAKLSSVKLHSAEIEAQLFAYLNFAVSTNASRHLIAG